VRDWVEQPAPWWAGLQQAQGAELWQALLLALSAEPQLRMQRVRARDAGIIARVIGFADVRFAAQSQRHIHRACQKGQSAIVFGQNNRLCLN
jgi:hypothetical protein